MNKIIAVGALGLVVGWVAYPLTTSAFPTEERRGAMQKTGQEEKSQQTPQTTQEIDWERVDEVVEKAETYLTHVIFGGVKKIASWLEKVEKTSSKQSSSSSPSVAK